MGLGDEPVSSQGESACGLCLRHIRAKSVLPAAVGSRLASHRKKVLPMQHGNQNTGVAIVAHEKEDKREYEKQQYPCRGGVNPEFAAFSKRAPQKSRKRF